MQAAPAVERLRVSISAVSTFRECQHKYFRRYVQGWTKSGQAPQLDLGIFIHDYLERYYSGLKHGIDPTAAHMAALKAVFDLATEKSEEFAATAYLIGDEKNAAIYRALPMKFHRLAVGYFRTHGKADAEQHEILLIESILKGQITEDIDHIGYCDLVTRHKKSGRIWLWEHKSHKKIPTQGYRVRNVQVAVYADNIEQNYGIHIDGILWNYLCTEDVAPPDALKNGKGLYKPTKYMTWGVYAKKLREVGLDPTDPAFADIQLNLEANEAQTFFPRYEMPIVPVGADALRADYRATATDIDDRRHAWAVGSEPAVRNPTTACSWCDFVTLCDAVLATGVEPDPEDYGFIRRARRGAPTVKAEIIEDTDERN